MNKGLEALKEMRRYGAVLTSNCEIIEKELKALEIIKNKIVDMAFLFETFNYYKNGLNAYNTMRTRGYNLTQEEYDLLKEVLKEVLLCQR